MPKKHHLPNSASMSLKVAVSQFLVSPLVSASDTRNKWQVQRISYDLSKVEVTSGPEVQMLEIFI